MHYIQREILLRLAVESPLKFSQLQPDGLSNNSFSYHLKQLKNSKYIQSTEDLYDLSEKGLSFVEKMSFATKQVRPQPKLLTMLYLTSTDHKVVAFKRFRAPFRGRISLPSGKVHIGETLAEAADRELEEKLGLRTELSPIGVLDLQYETKGKLITHIIAHVFAGQADQKVDKLNTKGHSFWTEVNKEVWLPEAEAVFNNLDSQFFVLSEKFESEPYDNSSAR